MAKNNDLEAVIGNWYKNAPHLPKNAQVWLADNIWWLALIGAVLSILGLLVVIPVLMGAATLTAYHSGLSVLHGPSVGSALWLGLVISLVGYIVTTVLLTLSVSPLKIKAKRGWELLFWSYLANFVLNLASALIVYNLFNVLMAVVSASVAGYFLYEINDYFGVRKKTAQKSHKK